ncbi:MAG: alpha/beta fold hydrolase [Brevinema sp.]
MTNKFILSFILFIAGCQIAPDGDVLYMKTKNSYHPIYVRGNRNAQNYIIWVHGGPGSSGLYYGDMEEVAQLHKKYRVIYWDQLSAGGTVGNPNAKNDFKISNYAEHVQGIINIIEKKYKPKNIYLLGHSWGGLLSAYYLIANGNRSLAQQRQDQVKGLITLNGVWNIPDSLTNGEKFITNYAAEQIKQGKDVKQWKKILKWYKDINGKFLGQNVTEHFCNIDLAGGMVIKRARRDELLKKLTVKMVFNSPFEFYSYYDSQRATRCFLDIVECALNEGANTVNDINIPTLMMYGKLDKIVFPSDTKRWHQVLINGKANADRDYPLVEFDNSAHAIFLDEKDKFIKVINEFINTHQ